MRSPACREFKESLTSYEKACKVVTTHLGEGHPLVNSLTDSYNNAKSVFRWPGSWSLAAHHVLSLMMHRN